MLAGAGLLLLVLPAVLIVWQTRSALGNRITRVGSTPFTAP